MILVSLNGTYIAKQTRIAMDRLQEVLAAFDEAAGRADDRDDRLGGRRPRHEHGASNASVSQHDLARRSSWSSCILLIVYRSPLLALIPLVTIALSVWISLMAIASLTKVPGLHFQVINITNIFVIVVLFGAGTDYCLFLIARYREELARGRTRRRGAPRGDRAGRRGPGRQRGDGDHRPGDALVLQLRQDPVHRPGDRPEPGHRPGRRR